MSKLRGALTYANVVATLALFIALGGASYAAIKLPRNSVGTKQIKKGAITSDKIRNGAIGSAKVRDGALRLDDFDEDEIPEGEPGLDGFDGRDGFDGLDGEPGLPGPPANPEWWVVVTPGGELVRGTAVSAARTAAGAYTVDFAGDRRGCGFIASLDDGAGSVAAKSGATETEDVVVSTFDAAGAAADRGFHLSARC